NGAWQVAGTIGIARRNRGEFAFPLWRNYDGERFEPGLDIDVYKWFVNQLPVYDGPQLPEHHVQWGYYDLDINRMVDLSGHMQSSRYFLHCLDEVRHYLTMIDEPPMRDVCAIHYRAGDYGDEYHPRLDRGYYGAAMANFPNAQKYLVFSDDIADARR